MHYLLLKSLMQTFLLYSVEQTRHVSMISITLSTKVLNQNSPG